MRLLLFGGNGSFSSFSAVACGNRRWQGGGLYYCMQGGILETIRLKSVIFEAQNPFLTMLVVPTDLTVIQTVRNSLKKPVFESEIPLCIHVNTTYSI